MQINITNLIMYDKTNISVLYAMQLQLHEYYNKLSWQIQAKEDRKHTRKKYYYDRKDIKHKTSCTHNTNDLNLYLGGAQFNSHLEYELW